MAKYVDTVQPMKRGEYYHVYNRGNNKETIFKESINYDYFLSLWSKYIDPIAETLCYNLLPNHFHFFIRLYTDEEIEARIAKIQNPSPKQLKAFKRLLKKSEIHFSDLFNAYAKAINKKYCRSGSLFQKKFRRKVIDNQFYFTILVAYILTNAVKHELCDSAKDYPWSSYQNLALSDEQNTVIQRFGSREEFLRYIDMYQRHLQMVKITAEFDPADS